MRLSTKKLFKQLEDRRKAMPVLTDPMVSLIPERPSVYPKNSLGFLADQLHMPAAVLIEQFDNAGISGLTPEHRITDSHKSSLLNHLRAKHSSPLHRIYVDDRPIEQQILVVQDITNELLTELAKQPSLLHSLDPRKFEELVARLLEDNGCEVTLTKRTRDGGYDIFGRIKGLIASPVFLAECKRYAPDNKVGVEVVRGLYGVTEIHRANLGLVITSSSFTKDAHEEKLRIGDRIELKEFNDLCAWLSPYKRVSG